MRIEESIFKYRSLDENSLIPFGFISCPDGYRYSETFMNGDFRAEIIIDAGGTVSCKVIDTDSGEEYLPVHLDGQTGAFVGAVRHEYSEILHRIADACFTIEPHRYAPKRVWIVPANPKYYDLDMLFSEIKGIIWKQSSRVLPGDLVYMYITSPVSAIRYQCIVTETDIPFEYADSNVSMKKVMKLDVLKEYPADYCTFSRLAELGITAIRGPRTVTKEFLLSI